MTFWSLGVTGLAVLVASCTAARPTEPTFQLTQLSSEPVEQVDSVPAPHVGATAGQVEIHGYVGLGQTGYELTPGGELQDGRLDLLITPVLPDGAMGLMVLTRYEYRAEVGNLPPGAYMVRVRHADASGGEPRLVWEGSIQVPE